METMWLYPCWLFYITVYDRKFIAYLHLLDTICSKSGDDKRAEWCLEIILLKESIQSIFGHTYK